MHVLELMQIYLVYAHSSAQYLTESKCPIDKDSLPALPPVISLSPLSFSFAKSTKVIFKKSKGKVRNE